MELANTPLPSKPRRRGRPSDGWDQVADGQTYVARKGVDYSTDSDHFRKACYAAAVRRGMSAVCHTDDDAGTVTFRFVQKTPDQEGTTA